MSLSSSSLLYAVYLAYALDCAVGVALLRKAIQEQRISQSGKALRHTVFPRSLILSRVLTTAVLTLCLLQMTSMTALERWLCIGLFACSLVLSLMTLAQRFFRSSAPDTQETLSSYQFPLNPHFEALWAANPQYYEAGSLRLRKVELPHWRFESPEFTDVLFVLEGIIMVETAIGSPNGAATHHAVDLVWHVAEEMNIRHSRAVLFSDAYNVRKSTFEARKVAAKFYGEAALIWDCYLFLNPAVRVSFQLTKPFAPSAFRSIRIANSFHEGLRSILAQFSHAALPENEPWQQREYSFPTNPYFEERWKYSLEYFEAKGVKLRKIQPTEWRYQAPGGEQILFMLEGAMLVVKVQNQHLDKVAIQAMMQHAFQVLAHNGNKAIPMALTLDFSDVPIDAALLCADAEPILNDVALLTVCCIPSPLLQEKVQASQIFIASRAADGTLERKAVTFVPTLEAAIDTMLIHFLDSNDESASVQSEVAARVESHTEEFHERRIEQIYTLLARIADNEAETLAPPQLPSGDLYADVFKAMEVVYEDKRRQMQEIMEQKHLLEKQSAHIQEVNTQLSFHNTQLDEQNQQLAALNNEKNELMSIVAHDLKNPIGAVRTMAELIATGQVAQAGEVAENIVGTANRMLALVGNLLDLNRLESGAKVFSCVEIDIAPFVESTMWQYRHAAETKNITFQYSAETSSTLALADEQAILQIVDNLISNAVKYSPQGKTIFIRIKDEAVSPNEEGSLSREATDVLHSSSLLRLEVQDEGEGISSEDMKRLFGKFARLSAQPTGGEHSTGLGLSIVKKMVEAMGGRVWCESVHGHGAMFIVALPRDFSSITGVL
jgi:signal transduction histidine kinase